MKKKRKRKLPEIPQGKIDEIMFRMGEYGRGSTLWVNFDLRKAEISLDRNRAFRQEEYHIVQVPAFSGLGTISFGFRGIWHRESRLVDLWRDIRTGRFAPKWKVKRWPHLYYQVIIFDEWKTILPPIITEDEPYPFKHGHKKSHKKQRRETGR